MAQQPPTSQPHHLRPDEIEILANINVTVGRQIVSGTYGGKLTSDIYEGEFADKKVAIKWLRYSEEVAQSVENELTTLTEINHPNIVDIVTSVRLSQYELAIILELADYGTVFTWLNMVRQGKLPPLTLDQFKRFANGLADGLRALHKTGRAHRDLHQGNVLAFKDSEKGGVIPKLADFGSVRKLGTNEDWNEEIRMKMQQDRDCISDMIEDVGQKAVKGAKEEDVKRVVEEAKQIWQQQQQE